MAESRSARYYRTGSTVPGKSNPKRAKAARKKKNGYQSKYQSSEEQKAKRASRNAARKKAGLKVGDKRDIHHKDGNPKNNKKSNLSAVSRKYNRGKKK